MKGKGNSSPIPGTNHFRLLARDWSSCALLLVFKRSLSLPFARTLVLSRSFFPLLSLPRARARVFLCRGTFSRFGQIFTKVTKVLSAFLLYAVQHYRGKTNIILCKARSMLRGFSLEILILWAYVWRNFYS